MILCLFIAWVLYMSIILIVRPIRIREYQDGKFYLEKLSLFIPGFWHRHIYGYHDGDIRLDIMDGGPIGFKKLSSAIKRVEEFRNFRLSNKRSNRRVKQNTQKQQIELLYQEAGKHFAAGEEYMGNLTLKQIEKLKQE